MLSRVWALYLEDHITLDSRKTTNQSNTLQGQYQSLCSYKVSQTSKRKYHYRSQGANRVDQFYHTSHEIKW